MEYRGPINSFTQLEVWKESHKLVLIIYKLTEDFPGQEVFGISSQLRRAAVSISSNIAEGFKRETYKEKVRFYSISSGSLSEVQNQLLISRDVNYLKADKFQEVALQTVKVSKLLFGLIKSSKNKI